MSTIEKTTISISFDISFILVSIVIFIMKKKNIFTASNSNSTNNAATTITSTPYYTKNSISRKKCNCNYNYWWTMIENNVISIVLIFIVFILFIYGWIYIINEIRSITNYVVIVQSSSSSSSSLYIPNASIREQQSLSKKRRKYSDKNASNRTRHRHRTYYYDDNVNKSTTKYITPETAATTNSTNRSNKYLNHDKNKTNSRKKKTRITIFYNLYIPSNDDNTDESVQKAIAIISEQIHQIGSSDLFYRKRILRKQQQKEHKQQQQQYKRRQRRLQQQHQLPAVGDNTSNADDDEKAYDDSDEDYDELPSDNEEEDEVILYYNSIGNSEPIQNGVLESWCYDANPKLNCIRLNHYPIGDESITLQSLHDYCIIKTEDPPNNDTNTNSKPSSSAMVTERVVYLHSKGTYHSADGKNDAWRRALTAAALHIDCIEPPPSSPTRMSSITTTNAIKTNDNNTSNCRDPNTSCITCNLCGLQFYTFFTFFIPGNMWTADCQYVKQLIPPLLMKYNATPSTPKATTTTRTSNTTTSNSRPDDSNDKDRTTEAITTRLRQSPSPAQGSSSSSTTSTIYQHRRDEAVMLFLLERSRGRIDSTLLRDRIDYFGIDRYASEHWISSHPHVLPCDVDPIGNLQEIFSKSRSIWYSMDTVLDVMYRRKNKFMKPAKTSKFKSMNDNNDNYISTDDNDDYDINTDDDYVNYDEYGFQFSMAPRHTGFVVGNVDSARDALLDDVNIRLREYYLLPGHILKWSKLYPPHNDNNNNNGTVSSFVVPTSDSWIWDWFPDGNFWRAGMEQYGIENVVRTLNQNYTFHVGVPSDQIHSVASAFSEPIINGGPSTIESSEHSSTPLSHHYNPHEHESDESNTLVRHNKEKQVVLQHIQPNITLSNESMKEYVVFYHISFRDSDNDEKVIELIEEQTEIIASSYAAIVSSIQNQQLTVFYTIIGQNSILVQDKAALINDICLQYSNIECRLLNQFDQDYEGETLNELHRFCTTTTRSTNDDEENRSNIDTTVIYINNQGPIQLRQEGISLRNVILHATMAVTDRLCSLHQHKPPSPISSSTNNDNNNETCNICGLVFYTLWTFFYPGNMFAAKCSYVRQLLSPKVYEYQMTDHVIGKILLAKIRMKLTMSLIPKLDRRPDYIGLDRYSIADWICSHPHIRPCDLSDIDHDYEYWDKTTPQIEPNVFDIHNDVNNGDDNNNIVDTLVKSPSYFHLKAGPPRHGNSIPSILLYYDIMKNWTTVRDNVLLDESKRLREYCYLAGHIFKWFELYNMTPPNDSWVWATDYFPDATIWREAVEKHGKDSIDVITAKYAKDGL